MKILAAVLVCVVMLTSCGSSSKNSVTTGLAGNWQMTLQGSTSSESQSGFLLQTGNTVTGNLLLSGQTISGEVVCAGVGSVAGQMKGADVVLSVNPAGRTINLTGTSTDGSTSMSGNYSTFASGCGETETGTWTATQVKPLTGNFQATFTIYGSSNIFHFTGAITQAANIGSSTATLSGNLTSTDSPCFTSASIAGVVTGTSAAINIVTSEGKSLGKYDAAMTTDATSLTGTYRFSNATNPDLLGACQGLGGTATFAVQASARI